MCVCGSPPLSGEGGQDKSPKSLIPQDPDAVPPPNEQREQKGERKASNGLRTQAQHKERERGRELNSYSLHTFLTEGPDSGAKKETRERINTERESSAPKKLGDRLAFNPWQLGRGRASQDKKGKEE